MLWVVVVDGPVQGGELAVVYVLEQAGGGMAAGEGQAAVGRVSCLQWRPAHLRTCCKQLWLSGTVLQCKALWPWRVKVGQEEKSSVRQRRLLSLC